MRLPLELQYAAGESRREESHTRDISSRGICFYLDRDLAVGSSIRFVLVLPPEITLTQSIRVRCTGTVVRVERPPAPGARLLVAATIQQYEYLGREQSN